MVLVEMVIMWITVIIGDGSARGGDGGGVRDICWWRRW